MLSFQLDAAVPRAVTLQLWHGGAQGVAVVNLWLCCFALVLVAAGEAPLRGGAQGVVVVLRLCCFASCSLVLCSAPGPAAAEMLRVCYACALGSLGSVPAAFGLGVCAQGLLAPACFGTGYVPSTRRDWLVPFRQAGQRLASPPAFACWEVRGVDLLPWGPVVWAAGGSLAVPSHHVWPPLEVLLRSLLGGLLACWGMLPLVAAEGCVA